MYFFICYMHVLSYLCISFSLQLFISLPPPLCVFFIVLYVFLYVLLSFFILCSSLFH